jgi:hypothetical protein
MLCPEGVIMTVTLTATFDGKVLRPEHALNLPKDARFVVSLVRIPERPEYSENPLDILDKYAGSMEKPPDWASEHDHYLYGTPKRGKKKV